MLRDRRAQAVGVADGSDDLVAGVLEQPAEPLPQQRLVLGDHDAHGSSAVTIGSAAGRAVDRHGPAERRDAVADAGQPRPRRGVAPPMPSSRTATTQAARSVVPLEIVQPDGPAFRVDGTASCAGRSGACGSGSRTREGLVLHEIGYEDEGERAPDLHRASIAEMVVPYGDPSPTSTSRTPSTSASTASGRSPTRSSWAATASARSATSTRRASTASGERARCCRTPSASTRRTTASSGSTSTAAPGAPRCAASRRLVVSSHRHGRQLRVRLLLVLLPGRHDRARGQADRHHLHRRACRPASAGATRPRSRPGVARRLPPALLQRAPRHRRRRRPTTPSYEVDAVPSRAGPDNPYGNAFVPTAARFAARVAGPARVSTRCTARAWRVVNPRSRNRIGRAGRATSSCPARTCAPFAQPGLAVRSAGRLHRPPPLGDAVRPDERYAAGDYPNQHAGGDGLPRWTRGRPRRSRTRTSCSGTRSARTTCRGRRTGR